MLHRRLVFLYLLIVFTSVFAQRPGRRDEPDDEDEADGNYQQQDVVNKARSRNRISSDNANNDNGDYQKPVPRQQLQPQSPSPTPLASSRQCQSDVQKYCNKGSAQLISNLKVLQCVDDLDNVSF